MQVIKVEPVGFASNSYIITADGRNAVIIDPSEPRISDVLKEKGLCCRYVLLTHGHFDHVGGCGVLCKEGAQICCGEKEKKLIFSKEFLGIFGGVSVPRFKIHKTFKDGEEVELCGIDFKIVFTPGHTAGGVCYVAEDCVFTGDTLMCDGIGRTDLPTGSYAELANSIKKLYSLEGDYKVYCGHGFDTTLQNERLFNPFVREE